MAEPTKQLRNRIWVTLSASFSILVLLILLIIYLLMSNNYQHIIYQTLNMRASLEEYFFEDIYFTVSVSNGDILDIHSSTLIDNLVLEVFVA